MLKAGDMLKESQSRWWKVVRWRGSGTCCDVYEVSLVGAEHNKAAVKVYKQGLNFESAHDREAMSLKLVRQCHGTCPQLVMHYTQIEHMGRKCLVQQLLDSNVRQVMQVSPSGALSLYVLRKLLADLLRGLYVLHATGFVHADLKPDNLLWSAQDGCLKVIDFSLSFHCEDNVIGLIQSQGYRAPEVTTWNANRQKQVQILKQGKSESGSVRDLFSASRDEVKPCSTCDMWSAGCILVEMFSSSKLFTQNRLKEIIPNQNVNEGFANLSTRVILKMVSDAFQPREIDSDSPQMVQHLKDLAIKLLNPNPGLRLSACEALLHPALAAPCPGPDHADLLVLPSPILRMMNLIDGLTDDVTVKEAEEDVHLMCSRFGSVLQCFACRSGQGQGKIFVHFSYAHQAVTAFHSLSSVTYNGHSVILTYFPLDLWHQRQLF